MNVTDTNFLCISRVSLSTVFASLHVTALYCSLYNSLGLNTIAQALAYTYYYGYTQIQGSGSPKHGVLIIYKRSTSILIPQNLLIFKNYKSRSLKSAPQYFRDFLRKILILTVNEPKKRQRTGGLAERTQNLL